MTDYANHRVPNGKTCFQRPRKRKKLVALDIIVKRYLPCKLDPLQLRYLN